MTDGGRHERKYAWTWTDSLVTSHHPCIDLDTCLNAVCGPQSELAARVPGRAVFFERALL